MESLQTGNSRVRRSEVAAVAGAEGSSGDVVTPTNSVETYAQDLAHASKVSDRYGDAGRAGWSPLPDVLLFNQKKLGISSEDLNVLLNLMAHYYSPGTMPFIRPNVIAKRMGVSTRSVQRSITKLRKVKLINKEQGPKRQVIHDLQPLIDKLQPLGRDRISDKAARRELLKQQDQSDENA